MKISSIRKPFVSAVAASLLSGAPPAVAQSCVQLEWSAPSTLGAATAYGGYVEMPEILFAKDGIMFVGSPGWSWEKDLTQIAPVAGFLRTNDGTITTLPVPPGYGRLASPRATVGQDGTLHILWVPSDSTGFEDRSEKSRVLSSRFVRGAWSTPATVFRNGSALYWTYASMSGVVSRGADRELIAPFLESESIARFQLKDTAWRVSALPSAAGSVSRPRLALPQKGGILIGFVDFDRASHSGLRGFYIRRSLDDGASWTTPVRISRPESEHAFDPFVFSTSDGRLVAVWTVGNPSGKRTTVAASVSSDTGRTWAIPSVIPTQGGIESMRAALARDGSLWVVVQSVLKGSRHPAVFAWNGRWSEVWTLPPNETESFGQPTIGAADDQIVVAWATRSATKIQRQVLDVTRYVIGHRRC
jgi:hypothetical protein